MQPFDRSHNRRSESLVRVRKFKLKRGRKRQVRSQPTEALRRWLSRIHV